MGFTGLDCFEFDCGIFVEFLLDFFAKFGSVLRGVTWFY